MTPEYTIINELNSEHIAQLYTLTRRMWWSKDRTQEDISTSLKTCMSFAAVEIKTQRLVGFARVLSDLIKYAYIYDVMTEERLQNNGIATVIINEILSHHKLSKIKYFELTCVPSMASFYKRFGFSENFENTQPMRLTRHLEEKD